MAAGDPIRNRSRVSKDRSGSCSDDVLSLDSWSENLEESSKPKKKAIDSRFPDSRSRVNLTSEGTLGFSHHQLAGRHPVVVKKDKSVHLRSESRDSNSSARDRLDSIPTIFATIGRGGGPPLLMPPQKLKRPGSSTSSDSDSSPLHSPRFIQEQQGPELSPSRRIPDAGTSHNDSHHLQFAQHHRLNYQSSPVHRHSAGHLGNLVGHTHRPWTVSPYHQTTDGSLISGHHRSHGPHHPYLTNQINSIHNGNTVPFDIEREGEKIKTKMKSIWNNVKYGWTIKTKASFKYDSPIFVLGRCYHKRAEVGDVPQTDEQLRAAQPPRYKVSALDEFHVDFTSRLWFTYRREFSPIGSAKMTTDCGWGCMLRSGQMMMAQGLVQHFLGRNWRVYSEQRPEDLAFYREIIRWFGDQPSDKVPFSLHRLVELGTSVGKMPGDWYGPASVAHIFRDAMDKAHASLPILSDICTYVTQDCTIYLQDLMKICCSHARSDSQISSGSAGAETETHQAPPYQQPPSNLQELPPSKQTQQFQPHRSQSFSEEKFRSVIILVPMRLGGETMNEIYIPCVQSMLAHDSCIGVIGGRPKHSLYFVGWQDDKLIYLDPHYCQDTVNTGDVVYPIQSFHCMSPRKMAFSKMDPSCTVGFYCRSRKDLQTFIDQVPDMVVPPRQRGSYPLFVVSPGSCLDHQTLEPPVRELGRLRITHVRTDHAGQRVRSPTVESEDFVIL